jgi:uncharacterized membrane protein
VVDVVVIIMMDDTAHTRHESSSRDSMLTLFVYLVALLLFTSFWKKCNIYNVYAVMNSESVSCHFLHTSSYDHQSRWMMKWRHVSPAMQPL